MINCGNHAIIAENGLSTNGNPNLLPKTKARIVYELKKGSSFATFTSLPWKSDFSIYTDTFLDGTQAFAIDYSDEVFTERTILVEIKRRYREQLQQFVEKQLGSLELPEYKEGTSFVHQFHSISGYRNPDKNVEYEWQSVQYGEDTKVGDNTCVAAAPVPKPEEGKV